MKRHLLPTLAASCVISVLFAADTFAGYTELRWQDAGKPPATTGQIVSCGAPRTVDIRVSYSLNPTFVIGGADPNCPSGFGPNPFRFTVTLYRDGTQLSSHTFESSGCWFRDWHVNISAVPGVYYAAIRMERRLGPWLWSTVDSMNSVGLSSVKAKTTPNFTINNMAIPANGTPISVKIANPIIMDGSSTACATRYLVGAEESDLWWGRSYHYEWARWFDGAPPKKINLQALATAYSVPPDWLGNDPNRQGTPLFGGDLNSGTARYYRIALCTMEPSWECKHALLRVE